VDQRDRSRHAPAATTDHDHHDAAQEEATAAPAATTGAIGADADAGQETRPGSQVSAEARVGVTRVDPWSVAKLAVIFWAAVCICAVGVLLTTWAILSISGLVSHFEHFITDLTGLKHFHIMSFTVVSGIALLCALATVVSIALTVLGAVFYNSLAPIVGGVEIDLEDDPVTE
jgi:hypothetical protein